MTLTMEELRESKKLSRRHVEEVVETFGYVPMLHHHMRQVDCLVIVSGDTGYIVKDRKDIFKYPDPQETFVLIKRGFVAGSDLSGLNVVLDISSGIEHGV